MRSLSIALICGIGLGFGAANATLTQHHRPRLEMPAHNDFTGIFAITGDEDGEPYKGVAYIRKAKGRRRMARPTSRRGFLRTLMHLKKSYVPRESAWLWTGTPTRRAE